MKYNKIFKTLLVLFIIIYFRGSVSSKIVSINLEVTNSNLFWLTFFIGWNYLSYLSYMII